jgi:hypothetical protein
MDTERGVHAASTYETKAGWILQHPFTTEIEAG